jgi:nucleoside-diphosphate-sugar epimerase
VPASLPPSIVVTGARGFIGQRVVEMLAPRAKDVRAGSRALRSAASGASALSAVSDRPGVTPVALDVMDPDQVAAGVRSADVVVHCAMGDRETTVVGTRNVLAAARREGVPRVVHLSSAVVYGPVSGVVDEQRPLRGGWSYADWKIAGEKDCEEARAAGLDVVVLRPSIVYGPRAATWALELGDRLAGGHWGSLGRFGEGICNLIFVDDLVEAIWLCASRDDAACGVYNVNGAHLVTWNDFFAGYNRALGLPPLRVRRPEAVIAGALAGDALRAAGKIARLVETRRGPASADLDARPTGIAGWARSLPRWRDVTGLYARKVTYEDGSIRRALGYRPLVEPEQGLAETAHWYESARGASRS